MEYRTKNYSSELLSRIYKSRERAENFFLEELRYDDSHWLYTVTHDATQFPAALLYGTWSSILAQNLLGTVNKWSEVRKQKIIEVIESYQLDDGSFIPKSLLQEPTSKSIEYLKLHCSNYSVGALCALDSNYTFNSRYFERFLSADFLSNWLDGRSLLRPWEEGNNIVNVASYMALMNDQGVPEAIHRLYQMLEWHKKNQNPKTGGFDAFFTPSINQKLQSLAGAVHNFHLYHYLKEPVSYKNQIAYHLTKLIKRKLTACLSIDFVELALFTLEDTDYSEKLIELLLLHCEELLASQRADGGWLEGDNTNSYTKAAGFVDSDISSCSYATWFRLCSLGMISICLLGDNFSNWHFRSTLGMGYFVGKDWINQSYILSKPKFSQEASLFLQNIPNVGMRLALEFGKKLLGL